MAAGIPSALAGGLGFASGAGSSSGSAASSSSARSSGSASSSNRSGGGGGGLPKWLWPLVLGLGILLLLRSCVCGQSGVIDQGGDLLGSVGDAAKSGIGAAGDLAGGAVDLAGDAAGAVGDVAGNVAGGAADLAAGAADTVGDVAGGAVDLVGDTAGAVGEMAGDAAGVVGEMAGDAAATLGSLTLPGGLSIETPEGSFTTKVAEFLGSSDAFTEPVNFDFDGVNFETGSARITSESMRQLNNLGALMQAYPNSAIRVEGHTDNTGNATANKTLSEKRAVSVRETLLGKGITPDRVDSAGFGQESPIATNDTEEGRAQNRRVSVVITRK